MLGKERRQLRRKSPTHAHVTRRLNQAAAGSTTHPIRLRTIAEGLDRHHKAIARLSLAQRTAIGRKSATTAGAAAAARQGQRTESERRCFVFEKEQQQAMKSTQQQQQHRRQQPRAVAARSLALLGSVLLGNMRAATAYQIVVSTPANSKEAGETFGLAFAYTDSGGTTGDLTSFDIELRSHDSADATTGCGDGALASLCTREETGVCSDSDGSYDVQIPEDADAGKYSIKIMLADDDSVYACTNAFNVTRPTDEDGLAILVGEASVGEVEVDAASSTYLEQGTAFTSRWVYDDGGGAGGGTFEINLNACGEDGACDNGG